MEAFIRATPEKSTSNSKQCQVHVACFLRLWRCCTGVLKRLRDAVRRKRRHFWASGDWLFHHDNAPAHSSNPVQQFLAKHKITQLRQSLYSPDVAPCDFWLFPRLKIPLKGHRFDDTETIYTNATSALKTIPKTDHSRTPSECGSTDGRVLFSRMGILSKDAMSRMTKNNASAGLWTWVGYFWHIPRDHPRSSIDI